MPKKSESKKSDPKYDSDETMSAEEEVELSQMNTEKLWKLLFCVLIQKMKLRNPKLLRSNNYLQWKLRPSKKYRKYIPEEVQAKHEAGW